MWSEYFVTGAIRGKKSNIWTVILKNSALIKKTSNMDYIIYVKQSNCSSVWVGSDIKRHIRLTEHCDL